MLAGITSESDFVNLDFSINIIFYYHDEHTFIFAMEMFFIGKIKEKKTNMYRGESYINSTEQFGFLDYTRIDCSSIPHGLVA